MESGSYGSKKVRDKKSKVKFYFHTVRSRVIPILKRIECGDYPSKIARYFGWSKQHVSYYIKKLEYADLIRRDLRSSHVSYVLTRRGQKFLTSCENAGFGAEMLRLHKCKVAYRIICDGFYPNNDFRNVEMVNWTALLGLVNGVHVRKTTNRWIVNVGVVLGRSHSEVLSKAKNLADTVATKIRDKYSVHLDKGIILEGYELAVDDPVARLFGRYFTISTPNRKMDHSLGKMKGEIDNLGRDAVVDYLMIPERMRNMERQMFKMSSQLREIYQQLALNNSTISLEDSSFKEKD